jgi:hypothetical protein
VKHDVLFPAIPLPGAAQCHSRKSQLFKTCPGENVTQDESDWLVNYFRGLLQSGSYMIDHDSLLEAIAKSQDAFLQNGSFLVLHHNARALARVRNYERVATFAKKPPTWKHGARAGYAVALVPKAAEVWDGNVLAHLRELLTERIGRALFNGKRREVAQFLDGMRYGFAFDAGKTTRKGVDTKDDYWPLIDHIFDEYFEAVTKRNNSTEIAALVESLLPAQIVAKWNGSQRQQFRDQIRMRCRRLGLKLPSRGRPAKSAK